LISVIVQRPRHIGAARPRMPRPRAALPGRRYLHQEPVEGASTNSC